MSSLECLQSLITNIEMTCGQRPKYLVIPKKLYDQCLMDMSAMRRYDSSETLYGFLADSFIFIQVIIRPETVFQYRPEGDQNVLD